MLVLGLTSCMLLDLQFFSSPHHLDDLATPLSHLPAHAVRLCSATVCSPSCNLGNHKNPNMLLTSCWPLWDWDLELLAQLPRPNVIYSLTTCLIAQSWAAELGDHPDCLKPFAHTGPSALNALPCRPHSPVPQNSWLMIQLSAQHHGHTGSFSTPTVSPSALWCVLTVPYTFPLSGAALPINILC